MRHRLGPTRCSSAARREGGCLPGKAQLQPLHARLPGQQHQHLPKGRSDRPSRSAGTAGHGRRPSTAPPHVCATRGLLPPTPGPFIAAEPLATPSSDWVLGPAPAIRSAAIGCPPDAVPRSLWRGRAPPSAAAGGEGRRV